MLRSLLRFSIAQGGAQFRPDKLVKLSRSIR